jgi:hypothetical protein
MAAAPVLQTVGAIPFDEVLADAVVLSWNDLMPESSSGLIHIEYHVELLGPIEFLKVWASTIRAEWSLICNYWMRGVGRTRAVSDLSVSTQSILQHQEMFLRGTAPGDDRVIQVFPPTDAERVAASKRMSILHKRLAL